MTPKVERPTVVGNIPLVSLGQKTAGGDTDWSRSRRRQRQPGQHRADAGAVGDRVHARSEGGAAVRNARAGLRR